MKIKLKFVRLLASVICVCLLLTGCVRPFIPYIPSWNEAAPSASPEERETYSDADTEEPRESTPFSQMEYVRPDTAKIAEQAKLCKKLIDRPDPEPMLEAYGELLSQYQSAETQLSLADILYSLDISRTYYSDEYTYLMDELTELDLTISDLTISILESRHKEAAEEAWGTAFAQRAYRNAELNDESVQDLFLREQELIFRYDELRTETEVNYGGRGYTVDELDSDREMDYGLYERLRSEYCKKLNGTAGPLFLEMKAIRTEIAQKLGFEDYSDYAYACYARDYTPEDAEKIHEAVKQYAVPLYAELFDSYYGDEADRLYSVTLDSNEFMGRLTEVAPAFSDKLSGSLDFMLDNGLYDLDVRDRKLSGGFTAYLGDYRSPFLFDNWDGSYLSASGFIHELGHFNSFYNNPVSGWNSAGDLDLSEVDSQGLELLFTEYYDRFFGDLSRAAVTEKLQDALYALITGCMEDEFQQEVYEDPDITLPEMNRLYEKLAGEYGLSDLYGTEGTEWVLIPHTFQTPLYYISYAVSMESALELWEISLNNRDRAASLYETLLERDQNAGFKETLEGIGLSDPFGEGIIRELCKAVKEYASEAASGSGV